MPRASAIRAYRPSDESQVIALWRDRGLLHPLNDPAEDIALCRDSGHGEVFVSEEGGAVVATIMVGHDGHRGWIYYLAVAPKLQGAGLGRGLVAHAEAWLQARSVPKVQLMIRETNTEVAVFYEAIGYRREPRTIMSRRLDGKQPL